MGPTQTDLSSLNPEQRLAVTSEAKRLLVLAGAGSGKTKTLLQKIIYLIEEKDVSPSFILAITFTKNAANEMIDRLIVAADNSGEYEKTISNKKVSFQAKNVIRLEWKKKYRRINNLTIKTFHSFCYSVLRNSGTLEFDNQFKIIGEDKSKDEDEFSKYLASETIYEVYLKLLTESSENTENILRLKRYVLDYLVDRIHIKKNTAPNQEGKHFTTLNGTKVRSKSEQFIADWLYRHNIPFEYEPLIQVADFSFHPDFYIPAANLIIEHVSNKSYSLVDKEKQLQKAGIPYALTKEEDTKDSTFFSVKLASLLKGRLPSDFNKIRLLNFQEEFKAIMVEVRDFLLSVIRVMDMVKVENLSWDSVRKTAEADQHERIREFYALALPLIESYNAYCVNRSYLDFNDMILRCINAFRTQPEILQRYQDQYPFILVDEFQDVNNLQVDLIKMLLTEQTQLFCVGDDWQSIYGFRGSNVNYIVDFEKHFENAEVIKLNLNYRSTDHIVEASNEVIKHNKYRIDKEVRSTKKSEHKIVVYSGNDETDMVEFCVKTTQDLIDQGIPPDEILFLYRRTAMFNPSTYTGRPSLSSALGKKGLRVASKTIHAAKGLEAQVVFILGLTEGSGGFPDVWMDDRLYQIIKKSERAQLLEEERRLFYVAITRAKEKLYLITEKGNESSFLKEIPEIYTVKTSEPISITFEKIPICEKCFSQLQKLWVVCPYCGENISTNGSNGIKE